MYDVEHYLSKCGKRTFVEYFIEIIKYGDKEAKKLLLQDGFKKNSVDNNVSNIKKIIKNKQIKDALANIADSKKVEPLYVEQARRLLKDLYGEAE